MNILQLRIAYPDLFNMDQVWFADEQFVRLDLPPLARMPRQAMTMKSVTDPECLTDAVLLVQLCVLYPNDALWNRYLWTADMDALGQRVYLGKNNGLMEIHRHIHITERFACPIW